MEFGIKTIKFEVLENDKTIHSGIVPSFFLNALTDTYCDYLDSQYSLQVSLNNTTVIAKSPTSFDYERTDIDELFD